MRIEKELPNSEYEEVSFKRRLIRERVLQMLYAYEISGNSPEFILSDLFSDFQSDKESYEFGKSLFLSVIENIDEIDRIIASKIKNWEIERLALIDKIALRIGVCELKYFPEIPPKVSINEAIELAKKFSTERSGKFVNGVLDAIYNELKETGQLNKYGRGLIDKSLRKERD
ncbi:MAG: transcription antitermination factor NusB [Candidatus Kryptonium sp.]|nr:transcription antitermination factor NusB [Candidatus Kryptonium sp.]